jgi:hypothetical protein
VSAPAKTLTDPVGTVITLVNAAGPGLGQDVIRPIVERVGGGRAKRRRLRAELADNPSVLTSGRSPASRPSVMSCWRCGNRSVRDLASVVPGLRTPGHLDAAPRRALAWLSLFRPPAGLRLLRQ